MVNIFLEASVALKVRFLVQIERAVCRQKRLPARKLARRKAQIARKAIELREVGFLQIDECARTQAVVALAASIARKQRRKLRRRQITRVDHEVDQVARERHAHGNARLHIANETVERGRGEHRARLAEFHKPAEKQRAHGVSIGKRERCARAEIARGKRTSLRLALHIAHGKHNSLRFGPIGELAHQVVANRAIHGLGAHGHARFVFVEKELERAGDGAIFVDIGRKVDAQTLLNRRQRRRAEKRHVALGHKGAVFLASVDAAQKIGALHEVVRASIEFAAAEPHKKLRAAARKPNAAAALNGKATPRRRPHRKRDFGVGVNHAHARHARRNAIGALDGKRLARQNRKHIDHIAFGKGHGAANARGRISPRRKRHRAALGIDNARDELDYRATALRETRGHVRECELLPILEKRALIETAAKIGDVLYDVRRIVGRHAQPHGPFAIFYSEIAQHIDASIGRVVALEAFGALHERGDAVGRYGRTVAAKARIAIGTSRIVERERHGMLAHAVVLKRRRARAGIIFDEIGALVELDHNAVAFG